MFLFLVFVCCVWLFSLVVGVVDKFFVFVCGWGCWCCVFCWLWCWGVMFLCGVVFMFFC